MSAPATIPSPDALAAPVAPVQDEPLRAIAYILIAMMSFACSDAAAKYLASTIHAVEIAWLRWVGFVLIMIPYVAFRGVSVLRSRVPGLQFARTLGILGSGTLFISGLHYLPLASNSAVAFAAPLFLTALSIPFLGEKVGPHRWAAVVVGLAGVLIVVRPGSGTYGAAALLPLLSALSWAFAMILTRKIGQTDGPGITMTWSAVIGLGVLSLVVPFVWTTPSPFEIGVAALMAFTSTFSQFLVVSAYRMAKTSVLAPISYSQLIWSGLLGMAVFGNVPDRWTLVGSAVIIGSGLYIAHRERPRPGH